MSRPRWPDLLDAAPGGRGSDNLRGLDQSANPRAGLSGVDGGSELGWVALPDRRIPGIPYDYFRYVVFKDPNWDYTTFNFDRDVALADRNDHDIVNATAVDLGAFLSAAGNCCSSTGGVMAKYHR